MPKHDEDVVGIGVDGGDEAAGPPDARFFEGGIFGGLAEDRTIALLRALLHLLGALVDDYERDAVGGELLGDLTSPTRP